MRRRGRRFFERREAKAETTFSRANALLHMIPFFETRETQDEHARNRPSTVFFCRRALVRTSYGHSVTRFHCRTTYVN